MLKMSRKYAPEISHVVLQTIPVTKETHESPHGRQTVQVLL